MRQIVDPDRERATEATERLDSAEDPPQLDSEAQVDEAIDADEGIELAAEDDRVIGRAFRWSLALIGGGGLLVALGVFLAGRPGPQPEERSLEVTAPEAVTTTETGGLPEVSFTDVTSDAGIDFVHFNGAYGDKLLPETMGGGVAFFDYDGDLDADLLLVNSSTWPFALDRYPASDASHTMALYENDGSGRFTDVTREAGLAVSFYGMGVAVADYDGDGDRDLFFTAVGTNHLFENRGGTFVEVTEDADVGGDPDDWSTGAAFFDYDGDLDLDLLVANYVRWSRQIDFEVDFRLDGLGRAYGPPQNYQGSYPYLYRNDGDGRFTDVSAEAGIQVENPATGLPLAKGLALAPVDADRDGLMDVLLANDTVQNFFFHNRGDGTFEETAEYYGLAYDRNGSATGAMGIDAAHHRNDANLAFLIGNFANEMSSFYVSQDDPTLFVDESISEGIGAPSRTVLTFSLFSFDYDLDGRLDVLQTNGHIENEINRVDPSQRYRQPAQLFWNAGPEGEKGFLAVPAEATGDLARPIVGRGSSYADTDGDGDLDVILTQVSGPPLLLRNDQALGHHWLRLQLVGRSPNTDAIGAWVELTAGGITQRRQVMPTRGYISQVELPLTFGLGVIDQIDAVTVTWPDGVTQVLSGLQLDRLNVVEQDG